MGWHWFRVVVHLMRISDLRYIIEQDGGIWVRPGYAPHPDNKPIRLGPDLRPVRSPVDAELDGSEDEIIDPLDEFDDFILEPEPEGPWWVPMLKYLPSMSPLWM